jgi:Family of unknown function (DUF6152)
MIGRILSGALLALGAVAVNAHHSFSMFDNEKDMVIEGEVKEFQWTNPHIWIQVNVTSADGKVTEYSVEGSSPNGLRRQGWSRNTIKAGDRIVLTIHPMKDGSPGGSFVRGTVNGEPLGPRPSAAPPPESTPAPAPAAQ